MWVEGWWSVGWWSVGVEECGVVECGVGECGGGAGGGGVGGGGGGGAYPPMLQPCFVVQKAKQLSIAYILNNHRGIFHRLSSQLPINVV